MYGLRWRLRRRLPIRLMPAFSVGLAIRPVEYFLAMALQAAPMVERQLRLAGIAGCLDALRVYPCTT